MVSARVNALPRLLLYARSGQLHIRESSTLAKALTELGFIGEALSMDGRDYQAGDRFMGLLTFTGCSPGINLSPEEGENFCFVRINPVSPLPVLHATTRTAAPYCRQCKRMLDDWIHIGRPDYCQYCDIDQRAGSLVWRKQGAFSRATIEVMHVYPSEAIPSAILLDRLANDSGVEWGYAYLQGQSMDFTKGEKA